jgi:hypothetical protein
VAAVPCSRCTLLLLSGRWHGRYVRGISQASSAAYKAKAAKVCEQLSRDQVVPVIALNSVSDAVPLAHALKCASTALQTLPLLSR